MAKGDSSPNAVSGVAYNPNFNSSLQGAGSLGRFGGPIAGGGPGGTIGGSFSSLNPPGMQKMLPNPPAPLTGGTGNWQQSTMQNVGNQMGMTPPTFPQQGGIGPSNYQDLLNKLMQMFQSAGPQTTQQQARVQYGMSNNRDRNV